MAGIDKTYVKTYEQYKIVRDWCKDKFITSKNGNKIQAIDFLYDKDMSEEYFNQWRNNIIQSNIRNYNMSEEEAETHVEIPIWNTPLYFDVWLIKNCPIDFIQERLKVQYGKTFYKIKENTSIYDKYKRNGLGKHFHYKVIKRPIIHPRYHFNYYDHWDNYKDYKEKKKPWWDIEIFDINPNTNKRVYWWVNTEDNYWTNNLEAQPFDTSLMMVKKKNMNIHKIIRMIKQWDLPEGTQVQINNRYFCYGWVINIKK